MEYRALKENEINFAVNAYEETLKALQKYPEVKIVPTRKTLDAIYNILKLNCQRQVYSYVVTNNKFIVGYSLICSDSVIFDTKDFYVYLLAVYIEPEFRGTDVLNNLLEFTRLMLQESGVKRVYLDSVHKRISPRLMKKLGLENHHSLMKNL